MLDILYFYFQSVVLPILRNHCLVLDIPCCVGLPDPDSEGWCVLTNHLPSTPFLPVSAEKTEPVSLDQYKVSHSFIIWSLVPAYLLVFYVISNLCRYNVEAELVFCV